MAMDNSANINSDATAVRTAAPEGIGMTSTKRGSAALARTESSTSSVLGTIIGQATTQPTITSPHSSRSRIILRQPRAAPMLKRRLTELQPPLARAPAAPGCQRSAAPVLLLGRAGNSTGDGAVVARPSPARRPVIMRPGSGRQGHRRSADTTVRFAEVPVILNAPPQKLASAAPHQAQDNMPLKQDTDVFELMYAQQLRYTLRRTVLTPIYARQQAHPSQGLSITARKADGRNLNITHARILLDTGANSNLCTMAFCEQHGLAVVVHEHPANVSTANGGGAAQVHSRVPNAKLILKKGTPDEMQVVTDLAVLPGTNHIFDVLLGTPVLLQVGAVMDPLLNTMEYRPELHCKGPCSRRVPIQTDHGHVCPHGFIRN